MLKYFNAILLSLLFTATLMAQDIIDGIAAVVGDKAILKSEVLQIVQMNALQARVDLTRNPALLDRLQNEALESLIIQRILMARAKVDSLDDIEADAVDLALDQQVGNIMSQLGSEERFEEVFGLSSRDFREDQWDVVRGQMIAEQYQNERFNRVMISRPEVIAFFEVYQDSIPPVDDRYELSQILVPITPGEQARADSRVRIDMLRDSLLAGADFASLATAFSDDPVSAAAGGDLGFVRRGEFVAAFEEVAFSLDIGETSSVVESVFGYHIIQLLDKQGERIHARHILVSLEPAAADRDSALSKTRELYFTLSENPELFDTLLSQIISAGNRSADLGYIGWIELGQMPDDAYRSAVFNSQVGDITPPFETKDAFHILKILAVKEGGAPNLNEYYPQIEAMALRQKQFQTFNRWLEMIRKDVFIKIL